MQIEAPIPKKNLFLGCQKKWGGGPGWGQKVIVQKKIWREYFGVTEGVWVLHITF